MSEKGGHGDFEIKMMEKSNATKKIQILGVVLDQ